MATENSQIHTAEQDAPRKFHADKTLLRLPRHSCHLFVITADGDAIVSPRTKIKKINPNL